MEITDEILKIIEKVATTLVSKYTIAYYDTDDIKQEIFIWSLEAVKKYDGRAPLENFLMINARNKCIILKRSFDRKDLKETDKASTLLARETKKNLLNPIDIDEVDFTNESSLVQRDNIIEEEDMIKYIDARIPLDIRKDYLKYKSGVKLSLCKVKIIKEKILEIMHGSVEPIQYKNQST